MKKLQKGQGTMEYGLAVVLIAVVVMAILIVYGEEIRKMWTVLTETLSLILGGG